MKIKCVRTRVSTVTCPGCKVEFYSRARHDYRLCGCPEETMVDGGFDYLRYGGKDLKAIVTRIRYVSQTRRELYDDWNHSADKFGIITRGAINAKA